MKGHDHALDGKLHDDCSMCDEIRSRMPGVKKEQQAEAALDRHQKVAERSRLGRDIINQGERNDQQPSCG